MEKKDAGIGAAGCVPSRLGIMANNRRASTSAITVSRR
jgi:hypothetical protein